MQYILALHCHIIRKHGHCECSDPVLSSLPCKHSYQHKRLKSFNSSKLLFVGDKILFILIADGSHIYYKISQLHVYYALTLISTGHSGIH